MTSIIKDWATARNGRDFSLTKLFASLGASAMIFNFVLTRSTDYQGLGIGLGAMIAALAMKYVVEEPNKEKQNDT